MIFWNIVSHANMCLRSMIYTSVENWDDDVSYTVEIHFEISSEESWIDKVSKKS